MIIYHKIFLTMKIIIKCVIYIVRKQLNAVKMALLWYLQHKDGLPNLKGSLLSSGNHSCKSRSAASGRDDNPGKGEGKRGACHRYTHRDRADIERYASQHDIAAEVRFYL